MKIALISHSYPTRHAPAQATFIKHEAHLIAQEHQVELHIPSVFALPFQKQFYRSFQPDEQKISVNRFSYLSFPSRRFASLTRKSLSKRLLSSLKKQQPEIVHLHWLYPAGLTVPALKKAGYTVVLTIHGGDWYSNVSNQKLMPLLEESLQKCDKIICVGEKLKKSIGNYDSTLNGKLVHIPHGIDTDRFYPSGDKILAKKSIGWNTDKIHLLCVGNLYHGKGIDLLITAFSAIKKRERHQLHIISPSGDDNTKAEIHRLLEKHSIKEFVTLYGAQGQEKLVEFYRASDLFISPSRKEGFGLAIAEALACGTPVLATQSGGPEEIITNENGLLVETENSEALKTGIEKILSVLNTFEEEKLHAYIKKNFSRSAKLEKLLDLYRSVTKT